MKKLSTVFNFISIRLKTLRVTLNYTNKPLLIGFISLAIIGLLMIYSASSLLTYHYSDISSEYFLQKQLIFYFMSLLIFIFVICFPFNKIIKLGPIVLILNVLSLVGVILIGSGANGVRSWYNLGFITLQPVEFVKIGLILGFAYYFEKNKNTINSFSLKYLKPKFFLKGIYFPILYLMVIVGLIMLQPDLGGAIVVMLIGVFMIATSGLSTKKVLLIFLSFLLIAVAGYFFLELLNIGLIKGYQMDRIKTWQNPFSDPSGAGYQVVHSLIAIASGGLFGNGLGDGIQKVGYIPLAHNDMIASNIAEEFGLIGIITLIALYMYICLKMLNLSKIQNKKSQTFFLIGFSTLIFMQMFINLGGVSGLIPLTGVTLPFVSYGGSSLISLFVGVGIVTAICARQKIVEKKSNEHLKIVKLDKIEIDDL